MDKEDKTKKKDKENRDDVVQPPEEYNEDKEDKTKKNKAENPDGRLLHMIENYFCKYFSTAMEDQGQDRGKHQKGETGSFSAKTNNKLSWRGMVRQLFRDITEPKLKCSCTSKLFMTSHTFIKHCEKAFLVRSFSDTSRRIALSPKMNLSVSFFLGT